VRRGGEKLREVSFQGGMGGRGVNSDFKKILWYIKKKKRRKGITLEGGTTGKKGYFPSL